MNFSLLGFCFLILKESNLIYTSDMSGPMIAPNSII